MIGALIREARLAAGMTQAQLADLFGIRQGAVSQWERDQVVPELPRRVRLAGILNIPFAQLVPEFSGLTSSASDEEIRKLVGLIDRLPQEFRTAVLIQAEALVERWGTPKPPGRK